MAGVGGLAYYSLGTNNCLLTLDAQISSITASFIKNDGEVNVATIIFAKKVSVLKSKGSLLIFNSASRSSQENTCRLLGLTFLEEKVKYSSSPSISKSNNTDLMFCSSLILRKFFRKDALSPDFFLSEHRY